jgi:hypothetical protein
MAGGYLLSHCLSINQINLGDKKKQTIDIQAFEDVSFFLATKKTISDKKSDKIIIDIQGLDIKCLFCLLNICILFI